MEQKEKSILKNEKWIEDFSQSSYNLWHNHDPKAHMPFNAIDFYPLYGNLWIEKLCKAVKKIEKEKISDEKVLKALPNNSCFRFYFMLAVLQFKYGKSEKEKVKTVSDFFRKFIKKQNLKDKYAKKSNICHSKKELTQMLDQAKWLKITKENQKWIGQMLVGASALAHTLYNDFFTDYGFEISGPYKDKQVIGKDCILLVREFPDLKPTQLWKESKKFKYKHIRIFSVYEKLNAKIEFVGCHINYSKRHLNKLKKAAISVDGKFIEKEKELIELKNYLMGLSAEFFTKIKAFDFEKQKEIYLLQEGYCLKELFNLAGIDWKPDKELLESLKGKLFQKKIFLDYAFDFPEYKEKFGFNYLKKSLE